MSGRAVRKALQRQREAELLREVPADENPSDDDSPELHSTPKPSLFALLNQADEDQANDNDDEDGDEEPEVEKKVALTPAKKKNKKKKKKKKIPAKKEEPQEEEEEEGEDEIDRALKLLKLDPTFEVPEKPTQEQLDSPLATVLKIDTRNLDAEAELRRLFGKDALREMDADATGAQRGRGNRREMLGGGRRGGAGRALTGRRNTFVQAKDDWPNVGSGGLGMETCSGEEFREKEGTAERGLTEFRFVHARPYQDVQRQFMICVLSMDPERMMMLLQHNPYHITTLLQSSEIFDHQRDFIIAGDLLERALFSLGRSLHSSFAQKLSEGTARLSFRHPENRELFLCSWRYIKNLSQRGTWRSAEEFARLLISLDPFGDPYEMVLLIDLLSLKSRQPKRLLQLIEHHQLRKKYSTYPNLAFSAVLAHLQLGDESIALEYLTKAITRFPWIPSMLYSALSIDDTLPPALWASRPPEDSPRQEILAKLYIERCSTLWQDPPAARLLVTAASAIHNLPTRPLLRDESSFSLSLARHIVLANIQDLIKLLPASITSRETFSFDPFPPDNNSPSYDATPSPPSMPVGNISVEELVPAAERGAFTTFVQSFLPWMRGGIEVERAEDGAAVVNEMGIRRMLEVWGEERRGVDWRVRETEERRERGEEVPTENHEDEDQDEDNIVRGDN